jgi:putative ABC transport system permease protein
VLAVGAAVSVTLLFEGFRGGVDYQMATPAASLPASLVVLEAGAKHLIGLRSNLPQATRAELERIAGVAAAHPLLSVPVIFNHGGRRTPIQLMAYDSKGAPRLGGGRPIAGPRQVVLDERLARVHGLRVGDRVTILDRELELVGVSTGTDVSFSPFAFLTYDELIDIFLEADVPGTLGGAPMLSFLLVDLRPGTDAGAVRQRIEAELPMADVYTPQDLGAFDVELGRQIFGSVLNLLLGVAWLAVILAVGLSMYSSVIDRRRDFGVMKALGVGRGGLASVVLFETLFVLVLAFLVGLGLARFAGMAVEALSPLYRVLPWEGPTITRGAVAALVAGLVGALLPIRRLARLEPDLVFRGA